MDTEIYSETFSLAYLNFIVRFARTSGTDEHLHEQYITF